MINNEPIIMEIGNSNENIDFTIQDNNESINFQINNQSSGGTNNYNKLINKPSINSVELIYDRTLHELGVQPEGDYPSQRVTNSELEDIFSDWN